MNNPQINVDYLKLPPNLQGKTSFCVQCREEILTLTKGLRYF